jgi:very-short-patch-repair endonuclease
MSGTMILFIAVIAFVVWHFLPERQPSNPTPKFRHEPRAIASDLNWQTFINEHCESPAETAFLKAMIAAHKLLPESGALKATGLKIDFQVQVDRYRLDFLANEWLIIEIDGAAWHSSDEAKARDTERDGFFVGLGYSVVRIPAKIVFNDPNEAVRRVSVALQVGKPVIAETVLRSGLERLRQTASSTNKFMSDLNASVDRRRRLLEALRAAESSYSAEKNVLDSAVEAAERQIRIDEELREDAEKRASYDAFAEKLARAFEEFDKREKKSVTKQKINVPPYLHPQTSRDTEIDREIEARFVSMSADREDYFRGIRKKLRKDHRLAPLVRANLTEFGCPQVWQHIA